MKKLFGGNAKALPTVAPANDVDSVLKDSWKRRDAYWSTIGTVENDVLGHIISPSFRGGPVWPTTRQAYRVVRRPNTLVLATDGMSDPFDGVCEGGNGFEMELFVETADIRPEYAGGFGDISSLSSSWAFELISHIAGTVAETGGITRQLERYGVLSMELPGVSQSRSLSQQLPADYVTADDCLGLLLGVPVFGFINRIKDMPLSPIMMVPITLITASELEQLRLGGAEARRSLVDALAVSGRYHVSNVRS